MRKKLEVSLRGNFHQQLRKKTRHLIQDFIKTFKNNFNVFWMLFEQVHVPLVSTAPCFYSEFKR